MDEDNEHKLPNNERFGWIRNNCVCFDPQKLDEELESLKFDTRSIVSAWASNGILETHTEKSTGKLRYKIKTYIKDGIKPNLYKIPLRIFEDFEEEGNKNSVGEGGDNNNNNDIEQKPPVTVNTKIKAVSRRDDGFDCFPESWNVPDLTDMVEKIGVFIRTTCKCDINKESRDSRIKEFRRRYQEFRKISVFVTEVAFNYVMKILQEAGIIEPREARVTEWFTREERRAIAEKRVRDFLTESGMDAVSIESTVTEWFTQGKTCAMAEVA